MDSVITVENLSKKYIIDHQRQESYTSLRDVLANGVRRAADRLFRPRMKRIDAGHEEFWALKDVSFDIKQGDRVGIVGRNGAGKSTLLKILSRITEPTLGKVSIKGRVASLLEVGTGFHPELTGRENIYLNGAIIGMSKAEIARKFDEIVAFAEIEKFLDTPVKRYSSGMYVRLAFAVAAHLDSDILVLDEVLAVGDMAFQKKCLGKMEGASKSGKTILFVSHGMQAVKSMCTRAIFLDQGRVGLDGDVSKIISAYLHSAEKNRLTKVVYREENIPIQFLAVELIESTNQQELGVKFIYRVNKNVKAALLCVDVKNEADASVFYANDEFWNDAGKRDVGTHAVTLSIPRSMLAPGEYSIAYGFWEPGREPVHFPLDRLWFKNEDRVITRLSSHNIPWPSVTYFPFSTWKRGLLS